MTPFPCSRGTPHCLAFLELEEEFSGQLGWGTGGGRRWISTGRERKSESEVFQVPLSFNPVTSLRGGDSYCQLTKWKCRQVFSLVEKSSDS